MDDHRHIQIPKFVFCAVDRHSEAHQPQHFTVWCFLWNIYIDRTLQSFDTQLAAEHGGIKVDRPLAVQIIPFPLKFRMRFDFDCNIKISIGTAV